MTQLLLSTIRPWRNAAWRSLVAQIGRLEPQLAENPPEELKRQSRSLAYRARSGEPLLQLLPEAYALAREAARRTLSMRHFDVQLLGGVALFHGYCAEMETGEGKTLTATLPLYLRALAGKGAHLATVNDYLARRDAEWMGPIYAMLGITVGVIQTPMNRPARQRAYACDVTYGTAKEFGFDFLKDRLLLRRLGRKDEAPSLLAAALAQGSGSVANPAGDDQPVHRLPYFALVDEADSILIDEARTPLIISAAPGEAQQRAVACFQWAASVAAEFAEVEHYRYDHEKRTVELTAAGRQRLRQLSQPEALHPVGLVDLYEYVERAIKVQREFFRDQHYVVRDEEIVIVDEYTGRLSEGRKWSGGIHQAVEAKEGVEVTVETGHAARITVQDFFLRYPYLAGMTGTARSSAGEFRRVYRLPVFSVPTNRPVRRRRLPDRVFAASEARWAAVVEEIRELHAAGRPVLIGTRSIDKSEHLSRLLAAEGIEHQVLNARHIAAEAQIVARAGEAARVTVATNMAGRGTDIQLGPGVTERGGLHVILTEMHDSARIDRQLAGRCGRQGDPGTYRQYLSLEDDLLRHAFGPRHAARLAAGYRTAATPARLGRLFRRAQRIVESRHARGRRVLLYHERERKKIQREMGQDPYLDTPE